MGRDLPLIVFKHILDDIITYDRLEHYEVRNKLIHDAILQAKRLGYKAGYRPADDCDNTEWFVGFIELPTGQVAWHMPFDNVPYDGHTTEEKYKRIEEFRKIFNTRLI